MWALVTLMVAAAPSAESARFAFELGGTPVGWVELSFEPGSGRFLYRSRHLFDRRPRGASLSREEEIFVDGQLRIRGTPQVPESLWLWRRPAPGCVEGKEELGSRTGLLCAQPSSGGQVEGTVFGTPFRARYDERARLNELWMELGHFVRLKSGQKVAAPPDLFKEGIPIEGELGALGLEPPIVQVSASLVPWEEKAAFALATQVHQSLPSSTSSAEGPCLAAARTFVALAGQQGHQAEVVIGLLAEEGRAYPHAWVKVGLPGGAILQLDPSSLEPVTASTHLAVGGADLLRLLYGRARVVRRGAPREGP